MGSLEHAPPFPCCGGMAFHASWCKGQGTDMPVLSAFRFAWRTEAQTPTPALVAIGRAFRMVRHVYDLDLAEVTAGWRLTDDEVADLEAGRRRFLSPADLHAALNQLWCWAVEKNPEIAK